MLESNHTTETHTRQRSSRWPTLTVLAGAIFLTAAPRLVGQGLYIQDGRSANDWVVFVLGPAANVLLMVLLPVILVYRVPALAGFGHRWFRWSRSEFTRFWLLPAGILTSSVAVAIIAHFLEMPVRPTIAWEAGRETDVDIGFLIWFSLFGAFLAPIGEEVFWRGYAQTTLSTVIHPSAAVVTQAVLFAVIHFAPPLGFAHALFFGLIVGVWRHRRQTLLPLILVHIANNCVAQAHIWHERLELRQVNVTHDYAAEFLERSKPAGYNPNDDAREDYAHAARLIVEMPAELEEVRKRYPTQWTPQEKALAQAWLVSNDDALARIERGTEKRYYWPRYEFPNDRMPPHVSDLTPIAKHAFIALRMRAELNATDGQYDAVFKDIRTCFRLGDHFLHCKDTLSQVAGGAKLADAAGTTRKILANEHLSPDALARLQELLGRFRAGLVPRLEVLDDRLWVQDTIQRIFTDDGQGSGRIPRVFFTKHLSADGRFESALSILPRIGEFDQRAWKHLDRRTTAAQTERYYELVRTSSSLSPWEYDQDVRHVKSRIDHLTADNPLVETFQMVVRVQHMPAQVQVELDAAITAITLHRYEAEKKTLPDDLTQLVDAGYLDVVPDDPYSDASLVYKRTDDSFILYSRGADFDDDGGTPSNWGRGEQGGDHVFWPVQSMR